MKKLISIVCITWLLSGCLYTKKRALEKFCTTDSIPYSIIVHDTIIVKAIQVDTFFNAKLDSFIIIKDRLEIRYKKIGEKVFIQGECKSDTIYKTKLVHVKIPMVKPKNRWWVEYYWLPYLILLVLVIRYFVIKKIEKMS